MRFKSSFVTILFSSVVAIFSSLPASAASALDLSDAIASVTCTGLRNSKAQLSYSSGGEIAVSLNNDQQIFRLVSLKKGVLDTALLLGQSADGFQHVLLTLQPAPKASLLQVNGTSSYLSCVVE